MGTPAPIARPAFGPVRYSRLSSSASALRTSRKPRWARNGSIRPSSIPKTNLSPIALVTAHQTLWFDPGPDWDEEKVAELPRCARQPGAPATPATATQVGTRREAPVILTVDAAAMHAAGHAFYQAANGIWLTDHVPPGDLSGWLG